MNEKLLMYSRRFIEDPDKVCQGKLFDVFTKIYWRPWESLSMKSFWYIHEDLLKTLIKFINEKFFIYSRRFIEDPDKVCQGKLFDVFTKIYWRPWESLSMKSFWYIHEDLLKTLIKFINEKFFIYSRRFIEDPD